MSICVISLFLSTGTVYFYNMSIIDNNSRGLRTFRLGLSKRYVSLRFKVG